ncbi:hypothetical protein AGMMS49938_18620 [Fibrobacterales bacterium]|nr:hypothetical protein AGMMS49938_18620 [Fibrobacterales bacterium]
MTGKTYIIKWDDLYEGSGDYSVDVIVSAAYSYSGLSIGGSLFSNEDSGYNPPQSFTATNTGTVIVTVVPYSPGDVGDYRIKYSIGELE